MGMKETNKSIDSCVEYMPLSRHVTMLPGREIKYLVIHYTAGSGSGRGKAKVVYSVFMNRSASADFAVDDYEMVQFNPDIENYYCWAVGGVKQNTGGGSLYGKANNRNTVSIEICSSCEPKTTAALSTPNHVGWYFTDKALDNAVKLAKLVMKRYNIPIENVIRHYDVTGKMCPGIVGWNDEIIYNSTAGKKTLKKSDSSEWLEFKKRLV